MWPRSVRSARRTPPTATNTRAARFSPGPDGGAYDPGQIAALAGGASLVADQDALGLTKVTESGSLTAEFGQDGLATVGHPDALPDAGGTAVAVTPGGGSYVVAGQFGASSQTLAVAQFTAEGALDTSFASQDPVPGVFQYKPPVQGPAPSSTTAADVVVEPDGRIVVVGTANVGPGQPALFVERLTSDGEPDGSVGNTVTGPGLHPISAVFSIQVENEPTEGVAVALGPNGTIYVAGTENDEQAVLLRLTPSLSLDTSFNPGGPIPGVLSSKLGGLGAQLGALAVAPDGDTLIGGRILSSADDTDDGVVARVTPTGSLDPSFGSGGIVTLHTNALQTPLSFVAGIASEPNGAPVIAGNVGGSTTVGGRDSSSPAKGSFVAQLTTSGALGPLRLRPRRPPHLASPVSASPNHSPATATPPPRASRCRAKVNCCSPASSSPPAAPRSPTPVPSSGSWTTRHQPRNSRGPARSWWARKPNSTAPPPAHPRCDHRLRRLGLRRQRNICHRRWWAAADQAHLHHPRNRLDLAAHEQRRRTDEHREALAHGARTEHL